MIGKLKRVPLREIWRKEAKDFTTWLTENIDVLSETLGVTLSIVEAEKKVGSFSLDILAEDNNGSPVIIENQLEKTDHDHLGKLITYSINLEAKVAVWISSEPRQEHIKAISWLNESTPVDFYLVKVEAVQIGSSEPAALFSLIASPSEESKEIGTQKQELAERHHKRLAFWEGLLSRSKETTKLFSNITPGKESWIATGAGKAGLTYQYAITNNYADIELYIDKGKDSEKENKKIFDYLYSKKEEIEKIFGEELLWERLDSRRASRIEKVYREYNLKEEDRWDEAQSKMIEGMIRFEKSLRKYTAEL